MTFNVPWLLVPDGSGAFGHLGGLSRIELGAWAHEGRNVDVSHLKYSLIAIC